MAEHGRRTMAMEHMRAHFAVADDEVEIDWCAVANARISVEDALETIRVRLGEPG
jgi:hypothetical protein